MHHLRTCGRFLVATLLLAVLSNPTILAQTPGTGNEAARSANDLAVASGGLAPFFSASGAVSLSLDAAGFNGTGTSTISVEKPAGATVQAAFLMSSSAFEAIADGDVVLAGTSIVWDIIIDNVLFGGQNARADVTTIVKPIVDAASSGLVTLEVSEPNDTSEIDGEALVVVFDDPNVAQVNTISLLYGSQALNGDTFSIGLADPFDDSVTDITLSLGISFGFLPSSPIQQSNIDVNGARLTTSAGGQDDCVEGAPFDLNCPNGTLITIGGIGDDPENPLDPFALPTDARSDDELYTLDSFVNQGATTIEVFTQNPSNDDNIFFAGFLFEGAAAVVGEGITLGPVESTNPVGTTHTVTATLQNDEGAPISNRSVEFEVLEGPSSGLMGTGVTDASGQATFSWSSNTPGTDIAVASFVNSEETTLTSNEASNSWTEETGGDATPPVCMGAANGATFTGTATDLTSDDPDNTGIASIALSAASTNLVLDATFMPGDESVSFTVTLADATQDGEGTVIATDGAGNTCQTGVVLMGSGGGGGDGLAFDLEIEQEGRKVTALGTISNDDGNARTAEAWCFVTRPSGDGLRYGPIAVDIPADGTTSGMVMRVADGPHATAGDYSITCFIGTFPSFVEAQDSDAFTLPELLLTYPNPFNPTTEVSFSLSDATDVTLAVYDALGRRVALLAEGHRQAGNHQVSFDASNLASGVYFTRLETNGTVTVRRITLMK